MKKSISTNKRLYGEKEMKFEVKGSSLTKVYFSCQWYGENIDIYLNYHVYRSDGKVRSVLIDYLREYNNELTFE